MPAAPGSLCGGLAVSLLEPSSEVLGSSQGRFRRSHPVLGKGFHLRGYLRCLVDVDHPVSASGTIRGSEVRCLRLEGLKRRFDLLPDDSVSNPCVCLICGREAELEHKAHDLFLSFLSLSQVGLFPSLYVCTAGGQKHLAEGMLLLKSLIFFRAYCATAHSLRTLGAGPLPQFTDLPRSSVDLAPTATSATREYASPPLRSPPGQPLPVP